MLPEPLQHLEGGMGLRGTSTGRDPLYNICLENLGRGSLLQGEWPQYGTV